MKELFEIKTGINEAFSYVRNRLFSEKTELIYDHVVVGREAEFPTAAEIARGFPNPCGYSTGMEDGMINGATMLDACLIKYEKEKDRPAAEFAGRIVSGMLNCAAAAKSDGFLPRAVSPQDGISHYPDSSRDQYTMFAFGMHRYLNSGLCTPEEKKEIARVALSVARRAERNVTREGGYDMRTDDGRPTLVTALWGDTTGNHESFRLPMLYLLACEASGNDDWREKYRALRAEAWKKALPMGHYWALYTLQQMQASLLLCYDMDYDEGWKERFLALMNTVADYAEGLADAVGQKIEVCGNCNAPQPSFRTLSMTPEKRFLNLGYEREQALSPNRPDAKDFFTLQDGAQVAIVAGIVPNRIPGERTQRLLRDTFRRIDLSVHERNLPLYFLDGYYRSLP